MITRLVFAFGSNLDRRQMARRCPSAEVVGLAALPGARLAFGGFSARWGGATATFVPDARSRVLGLAYRLNELDLARLDAYEGAPGVYMRIPVRVTMTGSRARRRAVAYKLLLDGGTSFPSSRYLMQIARAYRELGLGDWWAT